MVSITPVNHTSHDTCNNNSNSFRGRSAARPLAYHDQDVATSARRHRNCSSKNIAHTVRHSQCYRRTRHRPQHHAPGSSVLVVLAIFLTCSPSLAEAFVSVTATRRALSVSSTSLDANVDCCGDPGVASGSRARGRRIFRTPLASSLPSQSLRKLDCPQNTRRGASAPLRTSVAGDSSAASTGTQNKNIRDSDDDTMETVEGTVTTVAVGSQEIGSDTKNKKRRREKKLIRVHSVAEMHKQLAEGKSLFDLDARGDALEILQAREDEHPVLGVLRNRTEAGTVAGSHADGFKVCSCVCVCPFLWIVLDVWVP